MTMRSSAGRRNSIAMVLAPKMAVLAFCLLALAAAGVVHADQPKMAQGGPAAQAPAKKKPDPAEAKDAKDAANAVNAADAADTEDEIGAQTTTNLSITVLNKATGRPVPGAKVMIRPVSGSTNFTERTDTTYAAPHFFAGIAGRRDHAAGRTARRIL